jgi:dihydrofolate reductase
MKRDVAIIVAMTKDRVIGRAGGLPWHLSADLRRFKQLTMGHAIVMGRRTYESIGRLLPGRTTIVVTRQADFPLPDGAFRAASLDQGLHCASHDDTIFVIGGGQLYDTALPLATRLYITWVEAEVAGDTYFPEVDFSQWRLTEEQFVPADDKNEFDQRYCVYERSTS